MTGYALRVRQAAAAEVPPPLVSVQHTLSMSRAMTDIFPVINTAKTYPYDVLICLTEAAAIALKNLLAFSCEQLGIASSYKGSIVVIPLSIDVEYFCPGDMMHARRALHLAQGDFIFLYLGYCALSKADLLPVIAALRLLQQKYPSRRLKLVVAGTGDRSYIEVLREETARQKVEIVIKHDLFREDVLEAYRAADVFVSPADTMSESFGLTTVEAMACGLPQIVSEWNGYKETVVHGITGLFLPTSWRQLPGCFNRVSDLLGDEYLIVRTGQCVSVKVSEMLEAMEVLMVNDSFRREAARASRKRAVTLYSDQVVARQYGALWADVAKHRIGAKQHLVKGAVGDVDYDRRFSHYAGSIRRGETLLCLGPVADDTDAIDRQGNVLRQFGFTLEKGRLMEILQIVKAHQPISESKVWVLSALQREGSGNRHLEFVSNVGWLIKHGFLEYDINA